MKKWFITRFKKFYEYCRDYKKRKFHKNLSDFVTDIKQEENLYDWFYYKNLIVNRYIKITPTSRITYGENKPIFYIITNVVEESYNGFSFNYNLIIKKDEEEKYFSKYNIILGSEKPLKIGDKLNITYDITDCIYYD